MKKSSYNFYVTPTLIDSFLFWEKFDKPDDKFQEIIDKINKVPVEQSEGAKKGVAFESCINLNLSGETTNTFDDFVFDQTLVDKTVASLSGNIGTQVWIDRVVEFKHGNFKVGGLVDYMFADAIEDLKTTSSYKLGKYKDYSQHKAFGLIEPSKKWFYYRCTDFENLYLEPYRNKPEYHAEFIKNVERFWLFTQDHKELITDTKIWGNG